MRLNRRFEARRRVFPILLFLAALLAGCSDAVEQPSAGERRRPPRLSATERFVEQLRAGRGNQRSTIELDQPLADPGVIEQLSPQDDWLGELILDGGRVTDDQVAAIAALPELWHLRLRLSPISDAGLRQLAECDTLRTLNLPQSAATAEGVAALRSLPNLRNLRLGGGRLGADVAEAISALESLRSVHLIGVPIDDPGLRKIASLPKLQSLYLDDSGVTSDGWDWLFAEHSDLHVHVNQQHLDRDPSAHSHESTSIESPESSL